MRILLVVPPYRTTDALTAQLYPMPYGPVLLGSALQLAGHTVHLEDMLLPTGQEKCEQPDTFKGLHAPAYMHFGRPMAECVAWLRENAGAYDAVGLAMGQCNIWETGVLLAAQIKAMGLPLVVGGPYASTAPQEVAERTGADVVVVGEAEAAGAEIFERAAKGHRGIWHCEPAEMEQLPMPDWNLAPLANYPKVAGRVRGVLSVSRGCPRQCQFCSVHTIAGRRHRRHTRERIKQELLHLVECGAQYICFLDDNLFINRQAVDEVCGVIEGLAGRGSKWARLRYYVEEGMEVRLAAQPGMVERIAGAGFENIGLGLETMNETARRTMCKPYKAEDLAAAVANCRQAGVPARAFYIIGFPGDTLESVVHDMVEFGKLGLAARPNNLKLYPGTAVTEELRAHSLVPADYDWRLSSWWTPATGTLDYAGIKKLKTVLGAIGSAAEQFGVALFADSAEDIAGKMAAQRYQVWQDAMGLHLAGNMFRPTPYRYMAELFLMRQGAAGAESRLENGQVVAMATAEPKTAIQRAMAGQLPALGQFAAEAPALPQKGKNPGRCFNQDLMRGEHALGTSVKDGSDNQAVDEKQGTSIFDPVLCEVAYTWWCPPGGMVLDPFAGGSVRGIVASVRGRRYTGIELRAEQVAANKEQAATICKAGPQPVWIEGDSRQLGKLCPKIAADFIFSCPPYGDLEVYSNDPRDLSAMGFDAFCKAYREIITAACARLRDNRFACFVVSDFRDARGNYRNFPGITIQAFQAAGLRLYNEAILITAIGSLPIRVGAQFQNSRKLGKTHQNILVFVKGDAKKAVQAIGPIEIIEDYGGTGTETEAPGLTVS